MQAVTKYSTQVFTLLDNKIYDSFDVTLPYVKLFLLRSSRSKIPTSVKRFSLNLYVINGTTVEVSLPFFFLSQHGEAV